MIEYELKTQLMDELNFMKKLLSECVEEREMDQAMRVKIMRYIGSIKSILYDDLCFRSVYATSKRRPPV